jgi:hypothetical protein
VSRPKLQRDARGRFLPRTPPREFQGPALPRPVVAKPRVTWRTLVRAVRSWFDPNLSGPNGRVMPWAQ